MHKDTNPHIIDGRTVTIRPIRATDVAMEASFIRGLSPLTKHFRFFGAVNELPADELNRLCNVDGTGSMAFVATVEEGGREVEIGVSRYAPAVKSDAREMAVTIADKWQTTALASILVEHLIDSARRNGIRELYAVELADNGPMLEFAKKLGMSAVRDPSDAGQVVCSMAL